MIREMKRRDYSRGVDTGVRNLFLVFAGEDFFALIRQ
jgi:hypothetical protein